MPNPIPFIDLQAQRRRIGEAMNRAVLAAVESGQWIMGGPVQELESRLARFAGVKHAIVCANGTDALHLILRAWNVGPGDAVFVPAFTFAATAGAVALAGATPVFVDVLSDTFNMDPASLDAAVQTVKRERRLKPKVVISVDLFGQPADYPRLAPIVTGEKLRLLVDTAQAFGATLGGKQTAAFGDASGTSFFPAKPLGCYGDGGCCFTDDDALADTLRSVRIHGQGTDKYENVRIGMNSRLDTIQAAVLIEKLKVFAQEIEMRERIACRYSDLLGKSNRIRVPHVIRGARSTWAQYTIQVENREKLQSDLKREGVPTAVYYPLPLNRQRAYANYPSMPVPVSETLSKQVVSLPMHADLDEATQDRIVAAVLKSAA
ncbi:MAG: DegT/DnrJ/EryC1/StrS family aminotransferase [Alphaproteobacteria bacterium]